ncbi:MAG: type I 3-dehydroquinate dehydratase, partial [Pyrinomonadaceae bacterium]|nr:type I 3-dehydroquinate dehydratase [Pyrinomonadaceae bacterium]
MVENSGKICVSICAKTAREFLENVTRAANIDGVDVIELRFDCLDENELGNALEEIRRLRTKKPLLATFRPKEQGGKREISLSEREQFWHKLENSKTFDFIDVEHDSQFILSGVKARKIRSYHDFDGVPVNLNDIYEQLSANSDVAKIAVQADDICDSLEVMKLLERANAENKQLIPIAMGEAGKWTRILGLAKGAFMTYAALDDDRQTASGQFTAQDLIDVYRVKQLDENTTVYGLIGNPVSQSVSPEMHNAAFKFHNLNAVFIPFQVKNLDEFIARMVKPETREIEMNLCGFAVTIPHKQNIIKHLDFVDETAAKIGAVNTVKIIDGKLHGYNTDAQGFIEPLRNSFGDLKNAKVAIIGAGGAARAAIYSLKKEGASVTIFARNLHKAKSLADEFDVNLIEFSKAENQKPKTVFSDFDILVNATPQGMKGDFVNETPLFASQLEGLNLLYDLIYNPFTTK